MRSGERVAGDEPFRPERARRGRDRPSADRLSRIGTQRTRPRTALAVAGEGRPPGAPRSIGSSRTTSRQPCGSPRTPRLRRSQTRHDAPQVPQSAAIAKSVPGRAAAELDAARSSSTVAQPSAWRRPGFGSVRGRRPRGRIRAASSDQQHVRAGLARRTRSQARGRSPIGDVVVGEHAEVDDVAAGGEAVRGRGAVTRPAEPAAPRAPGSVPIDER